MSETPRLSPEWFHQQAAEAVSPGAAAPSGVPGHDLVQRRAALQAIASTGQEPDGRPSTARVVMEILAGPANSGYEEGPSSSYDDYWFSQGVALPPNLFGPSTHSLPPASGAADTATPHPKFLSRVMHGALDLLPRSRAGRIALVTTLGVSATGVVLARTGQSPADVKATVVEWAGRSNEQSLLFKTDCVSSPQAAFSIHVTGSGDILPRIRLYPTPADAAKAKANPQDPSTQIYDGFPEENPAAAYMDGLPATPFVAGPAGTPRLPGAEYDATLGITVCTKPDAAAAHPVVKQTGPATAEVDATQLILLVTGADPGKKQRYEMPAITTSPEKAGLLPSGELERLNAVFHPNAAKPADPNLPLLVDLEIKTLDTTINGQCAAAVNAAAKAAVADKVSAQNGKDYTLAWSGGFGSPTDAMKAKPANQISSPDAHIINLRTACQVSSVK